MVICNIQHFLLIYVLAKFAVVCFLLMCLFRSLPHIIWQLHICIFIFHHVIFPFYCAHEPHHALDEGKPLLHIAALFFLWTCLLQYQQLISNKQYISNKTLSPSVNMEPPDFLTHAWYNGGGSRLGLVWWGKYRCCVLTGGGAMSQCHIQ